MIHREKDPTLKAYLAQVGLKALGFDPGEPDNWWGAKSETARQAFLASQSDIWHAVKATSFADPVDVAAFRRCKAAGKSDNECFKVGDNGVGFWEDDLTVDVSYCALPPEDMIEKWGDDRASAKHKSVVVKIGDAEEICLLGDHMPHRANIHNGAGIDLNPFACKRLGVKPPLYTDAMWRWA